jgi:hypothetical protein
MSQDIGPRYRGKMKSAQSTVDSITTLRQARTKIGKAQALVRKHEFIIKQEGIKIATYRKQINLLKTKFPECFDDD